MATWVYFAAAARAGQDDTIQLALRNNVIVRPARNEVGALIANVRHFRPGDRLLLVYRQGAPHIACVSARIAAVDSPVSGTRVIQRVEPPHSQEFLDAGYPKVDERGAVEVIQLEDVSESRTVLAGTYGGQGTIHQLAPEDGGDPKTPEDGTDQAVVPPVRPKLSPSGTVSAAATSGESPEARVIRGAADPRQLLFDAYVMIDWSSRGEPVMGENSIWIAWGHWNGDQLEEIHTNADTRARALGFIRDRLRGDTLRDKRVLVGFDFAFGYPHGFAAALGLQGTPWHAVLEYFRRHVADNDNNQHNRDAFAAQCNSLIGGGGPGPFWGCHNNAAHPNLTTHRVGVFDFPYDGLTEYRLTERRARAHCITQSVWKLNQGVSVGGQTILGVKYLADLRFEDYAAVNDRISIWPFETDWCVPSGSNRIVLAEIFPSVLPIEDDLGHLPRDLAQVPTCVRHAASLDALGQLADQFHRPAGVTEDLFQAVTSEEGWILFVR